MSTLLFLITNNKIRLVDTRFLHLQKNNISMTFMSHQLYKNLFDEQWCLFTNLLRKLIWFFLFSRLFLPVVGTLLIYLYRDIAYLSYWTRVFICCSWGKVYWQCNWPAMVTNLTSWLYKVEPRAACRFARPF